MSKVIGRRITRDVVQSLHKRFHGCSMSPLGGPESYYSAAEKAKHSVTKCLVTPGESRALYVIKI